LVLMPCYIIGFILNKNSEKPNCKTRSFTIYVNGYLNYDQVNVALEFLEVN
jgi:hypothetical protein